MSALTATARTRHLYRHLNMERVRIIREGDVVQGEELP